MMNVQGKFTGGWSEAQGTYIYEYTCERCGATFSDTSPEVSAPAICHGCLTGTHQNETGRRGRDKSNMYFSTRHRKGKYPHEERTSR